MLMKFDTIFFLYSAILSIKEILNFVSVFHRQFLYLEEASRYKLKKKMSITASTCQEICRSPTNSSPSKMLYSFSKSSRFPKRRRILCDKFYQHASSVSPSRTTTFGFGNKYQFTKNVPISPPPNTYTIRSNFQKPINTGFGFGQGRSEMEITGPLVQTILNKNPGPGTYQVPSTLGKLTFSMTGKNYHQNRQKKLIPGPGSYPITFGLNPNGQYFLAKHKCSLARNFSKLPCRASTAQKLVPGPGAYDISKQMMSPDGKYITSKMHNSYVRRFGSSIRALINQKNETPGPGNYKLPSQFGHYICKDASIRNSQKDEVKKEKKETKEKTQLTQNTNLSNNKQNKEIEILNQKQKQ